MAKRDVTQVKQELRILKRENAELQRVVERKTENSAEMNRRLRKELRSCQDSQRQLAENCKHYRQRLADSTDVCSELGERLYYSDSAQEAYRDELNDKTLEIKELQKDKYELRTSRDTLAVVTAAFAVFYVVTEGLRFFGVL